MSEGVEWIKTKLIEMYGKDVSLNLPNYRIVWSTSQFEKRLGTFEDVTEAGIYLRTVTEVREVYKYPLFLDMWILEALQPNLANPELTEKVSYEPLWIFGANNSERQPVWRAVEMIVKAHKFVGEMKKISLQEMKDIEAERFLKEKILFKDIISNESPYIAGALHDREAVVVPHNFEKSE